MEDKQEFSDTPTGDAAEEFLKSKNGQESKPSLLKQEVLKLYAEAESIKKLLQEAALQGDPILLDEESLRKKYGVDFAYGAGTLADIRRGDIDLTYWFLKEPLDPTEPRIALEEQSVIGITLRNWTFGEALEEKGFTDGHAYMLDLRTQPSYGHPDYSGIEDSDDTERDDLIYSFYLSDKSDWLKERFSFQKGGTLYKSQKSLEITPHDLEVAGAAIGILKSHLTKILAPPKQDQ